jgi:hypothetical protein
MLIVGIDERPVNVEDGNGGVCHSGPLPANPVPNRAVIRKGQPGSMAAACLALFGTMLMLLAAAPNLAILALLMIPLGVPLSPWLGR